MPLHYNVPRELLLFYFFQICTYSTFFHYLIPLMAEWKTHQFALGLSLVPTHVMGIIKHDRVIRPPAPVLHPFQGKTGVRKAQDINEKKSHIPQGTLCQVRRTPQHS